MARQSVLLVLSFGLAVLTGCSDKPTPAPVRTAYAADGPSRAASNSDPAEDQARQQVLATYNGYLEAYITASAAADYRTDALKQYVAEPLLGQLLNNLFNMSRSGVHNEGRPRWSPTVTELRLGDDQTVIQDCFDSSNWNAVGGKAKPTAQAKKYPVVVKVKRIKDRWYVYESTAQRSSTC